MAAEDIAAMIIVKHGVKEIPKIIDNGTKDYLKFLENVAIDIYDSCIQDYYAQYKPKVYTRHGNKAGFNLYQAKDIGANDFSIKLETDPYELLPYGTAEDIRAEVLKNVMSGVRGYKERTNNTDIEWPSPWSTSYPNKYSRYSIWSSSCFTIESILDDFAANAIKDTYEMLWEFIAKYA